MNKLNDKFNMISVLETYRKYKKGVCDIRSESKQTLIVEECKLIILGFTF